MSVEFPDIGCRGACGFVRAGRGLACEEMDACGRYIHPGDVDYDKVAAYYAQVHPHAAHEEFVLRLFRRLQALEAIRDDKELRVYVSRLAHNELDLHALIDAAREMLQRAVTDDQHEVDRPALEPTVELGGLVYVKGGVDD